MGLLSNLFRKKPAKSATTSLGTFELVYDKPDKRIWSNHDREPPFSVGGSADSPDPEHIELLASFEDRLAALSDGISERFRTELREAEVNAEFGSWRDRFKVVGADVRDLHEGEAYWSITFEDRESPYYQFTLFIEGDRLTDFSIDS